MRVAVVGGTGLVGRRLVAALAREGHEAVALSRSSGVDVSTGAGLRDALAGTEAVVDVLNHPVNDRAEAKTFFGSTTSNLLEAEGGAGVSHHVLLSIVNVDRMRGNAHYSGKRRQEELVREGRTPWTIVRAAEFFEFGEMVAEWTREGDTAVVPPILVQPLSAADAADTLVEVATGPAQRAVIDVVGPEPQDLVDMVRRTLDARGTPLHIHPSWDDGPFGVESAGNVFLPDPGARQAPTRFDDWLDEIRRS